MNYLTEYISLYENDRVVVKGGMAAYLQLNQCGIQTRVEDIDVSITTNQSGKVVLDRWLSILPSSYKAEYDTNYPISIVTLDDQESGQKFDLFINEDYISSVDLMDGILVESLDGLIKGYHQYLIGSKQDIDLIRTGQINWDKDQLTGLIDKHNRTVERLKLLVQCYQIRKNVK